MRVQIACLANSKMEKGRILIGVLMKDGEPVVNDSGPQWLHLVVDAGRPTVPSGLIVDILPMDLIEVELEGVQDWDQCKGTVVFVTYSLRFTGSLQPSELVDRCLSWKMHIERAGLPTTKVGSLFLLEAQRCELASDGEVLRRSSQLADLQFESDGQLHRYPIRDPWFLEAIQLNPNLLAKKGSHYILVKQDRATRSARLQGNVMTILF